jgi:hypothetical protein
MKTKDLVYIGLIGYLAFLLLKKKPLPNLSESTDQNANAPTAGNQTNGGLNLNQGMDLPNLTPTSPDGLSTEVALSSSNVTPLIKDDNEPTQVFGNYNLPTPYNAGSTSVVNPNPIDVVPANTTTVSEVYTAEPIGSVGANNEPFIVDPKVYTDYVMSEPETQTVNDSVKGGSLVSEPALGNTKTALSESVKNELISECGNSFSIPNNDKEGSYVNYWFDGTNFYIQTTSPLIKTVPVKISKDEFVEGCKKLQLYKLKNS